MKKYLLIILLFAAFTANAQKFAIGLDKENIFYVGLDNPVTIVAENTPAASLIVKTNIGTIMRNDRSGHYEFHTDSIGRVEINVYKKVNGHLQKLGTYDYRAKKIPDPIAKIGPAGSGQLSKVILSQQQYMRAEIEDFDIDAHFTIDSFTTVIVRRDSCLYQEVKNITGKLSDETTKALSGIKKDDTIIFKNIYAQGPQGISIELKPFFLIVTD